MSSHGVMSDMTSRRLPLQVPLLIGVVLLFLVGAVAMWIGWLGGGADLAAAPECRAAQAVAQRLAPLARGEVAAVAASTRPAPAPEVAFQGPAGQPLSL